jgi:hypothetical protein
MLLPCRKPIRHKPLDPNLHHSPIRPRAHLASSFPKSHARTMDRILRSPDECFQRSVRLRSIDAGRALSFASFSTSVGVVAQSHPCGSQRKSVLEPTIDGIAIFSHALAQVPQSGEQALTVAERDQPAKPAWSAVERREHSFRRVSGTAASLSCRQRE